MTINHQFNLTGLLVKPNAQESDSILAKAEWECVFWRGDFSVRGAGASYLTRESKPAGVELAEITPDQAVEWMIASEGGQPFVDRLIKGHEWFILEQENRAQLQRLFGQEPAEPTVPQSVSRLQGLAALMQAGYMDEINAYMSAPDTDPFIVLAYNNANEFWRNSPTVSVLQSVIGLTDSQLDDLFRFAGTIQA